MFKHTSNLLLNTGNLFLNTGNLLLIMSNLLLIMSNLLLNTGNLLLIMSNILLITGNLLLNTGNLLLNTSNFALNELLTVNCHTEQLVVSYFFLLELANLYLNAFQFFIKINYSTLGNFLNKSIILLLAIS